MSKLTDPNRVRIELHVANDISIAEGLREFADMINNSDDDKLNKLQFTLTSDCTEATVSQEKNAAVQN